jgi:two-component system CheB/CheR fusion protein
MMRGGKSEGPEASAAARLPLAQISAIMGGATGVDLGEYGQAAVLRGVQLRMRTLNIEDGERYMERLQADRAEAQRLLEILLIGVTAFFRDPSAFDFLGREIVPKLSEGKAAGESIRIWAPGCATGEETYSLAMLVREQLAEVAAPPHVQIFATDIDVRALATAHAGHYPAAIARQVSRERLARWFVKDGDGYRVAPELRQICVFSPHNLVRDPPFSAMDLVVCRNVLIHMSADLRDRAAALLHFALSPGGYLFMGRGDNGRLDQSLFASVSRRHRLFRRIEPAKRVLDARFPRLAGQAHGPPIGGALGRRVEEVAERYAPAYLVVDRNLEVLHFSGHTGPFLEPAEGAATLNLLDLAHPDLRVHLRTALHTAASEGGRSEARHIRVSEDGAAHTIRTAVEPVASPSGASVFVVLFQDEGPVQDKAQDGREGYRRQLEAELRTAEDRLQATLEGLESATEELKATNEEYQAIIEELQSSQEELETSERTLQATNLELRLANTELADRIDTLTRDLLDLRSLLDNAQIAAIVLDNDLGVVSFTAASAEVFDLTDEDVGRPIVELAPRLAYPGLEDDAREVLKSLRQVERLVRTSDGGGKRHARVRPYRAADNFIAGVVVTFQDITDLLDGEGALQAR